MKTPPAAVAAASTPRNRHRRPEGCPGPRCRYPGSRLCRYRGREPPTVALPASNNCHVLPVFSLRQIRRCRTAHRGVDDHLAGRRQLGIDDDLVSPSCRRNRGCGPSMRSAANCRWNRRCRCCREGPGRAAVHRDQEADAGRGRCRPRRRPSCRCRQSRSSHSGCCCGRRPRCC